MTHLKETTIDLWHRLGRAAKAFASGIATGLSYLVGVWGEQTTTSEAFTSLTAQQWGLFALAVLGGWGVTYRTKNR